jgi:hypothetical protein
MSDTLHLSLKAEYFDAIRDGTKLKEYRLTTPYWRRRLEMRAYSRIVLTKGYPSRTEHHRRLTRAWRGYTIETITHPFFGPEPVNVFAIDVSGGAPQEAGDGKENS